MAHKKGVGSSRNGRDTHGKRLGPKAFAGQTVTGGSILVRQRGNRFWPGENVGEGKDCSLFAKVPGVLRFVTSGRRQRRYIHVDPVERADSSN
ncbi:50S ribosomal protein L27 [bacterium]|nr:50S ribosomal protein L27 [bacterium]